MKCTHVVLFRVNTPTNDEWLSIRSQEIVIAIVSVVIIVSKLKKDNIDTNVI